MGYSRKLFKPTVGLTCGLVLTFVISCTVFKPPAFERGLEAFNNKNYATAYAIWEPEAQAGNPKAQNALGWLYAGGLGVERDDSEAVRWYRAATDQGHGGAQLNLANHYYYGLGVSRDQREAAEMFRASAEQGYAEAQNSLARMYRAGEGVPQDQALAAVWFERAAEKGFPPAQNSLGLMYFRGEGVARDYGQAYYWLELAVRRGVPGAEHNRDFVASFLDSAGKEAVLSKADAWRPEP